MSYIISINKVNLDERFPNSGWLTGKFSYTGIHYDNSLLANDGILLSSGTISDTSVNDVSVFLPKPGSSVISVYEVVNNGTTPAMLDSISDTELNITAPTVAQPKDFSHGIFMIPSRFILDDGTKTNFLDYDPRGAILYPGESVYIMLMSGFFPKDFPYFDVTMSDSGFTLNFVEVDKNACNSELE